ncbi:SMC5-SMC6 complex localization factor protein 1 [Bufo bufo]|uniref:SMC5-SMC6 complex localization factor protein 1 n=1 Tax=Bufo bufo TaxID=8384 RepID=UPI001ABE4CAE|nr:SMC5-SMC6 complex localization factor protein 1 [Bufo bufo]XP_040277482.1 SMC5-SMC6 complex localization factor protein 1 [Bufo bufo]XP_040277483.1 SMC5-SMC6 complex localization factor protein 1 [Bufo bufo]
MAVTQNKRIVQLTGFRDVERETLIQLVRRLPCVCIDSEKFENCTHLIAERPNRSEKWLAACAAGKWVLTKEYVINSAESGRWLDETTFEWGYKIEKDAHYSPQMQSAPKRWREHLTHTRALGAFSRWKVTLLIEEADKEREALLRVLTAGHATVLYNPHKPDEEITHVFTNNRSFLQNKEVRVYSAQYHSVLYIGTYLLQDPIHTPVDMTEEQVAELKSSIWKRICAAQACHHRCIVDNGHSEKRKLKVEIGRTSLNRIEELIEGQFFTEAFGEIRHLIPLVFPQHVFELLLKHFMQGNVEINNFGQLLDIFFSTVRYRPPWESNHMVQYYLNALQCPVCKKGTWAFIETLIKCFLEDRFCLCHETSDMQIDSHKRRKIVATILKFLSNVMQEEAKALSKKLCEQADLSRKTLCPSFILGIFWPETRTMVFLTKNMSVLTDLLIMCHKKMHPVDDALSQEVTSHLSGMLAAVVEYWILLGFYLNKKLVHQVASDFVFYISVSCEEFTVEEKKMFVSSIASPWLQMLVAEVIFKNLCTESSLQMSNEPLTLRKLISTYIPALWKAVACGNEKVQNLARKRKIGQRPCLESQRALLMLSGENQNQGDALLDLPIAAKLRCKTRGESSQIKEPQVSRQFCSGQDRKGETAMHRACRSNNVKKLHLQLSLPGIDINAKDNAGWTPLHEACNHGSTECVREILQRCPEVDLLSHVDGVTPLHDALQNGHIEIGKMLLQHGGAVILQKQDSDGKFPLDYISSPQLKNELFAVVEVEESVEDFHKIAIQASDNRKLEFGAFLLFRMLVNFISVYGLPSDAVTAKALYPDSAFLAGHSKSTHTAFSNLVVETYLEALATMDHLNDCLQSIPDSLLEKPGFNMQVLLSVLHTLASSSQFLKTLKRSSFEMQPTTSQL